MPDPTRILIIRPSALGDVARSVPVLASLRARYPDAHIAWLVQKGFEPAIEHHPALDEVITFDRRGLGESSKRADPRPTLAFLKTLHRRRFDLVIDAQGLFRSGLFAWATGAPKRVGFANARELGWAFLSHRHHIDRNLHSVDRMLALLHAAGIKPVRDVQLHADPAELEWVAEQPWASTLSPPPSPTGEVSSPSDDGGGSPLSSPVADGAKQRSGNPQSGSEGVPASTRPLPHRPLPTPHGLPYTTLAPTSRWPAKQWPAERFAELARRLLARGTPRIVIVGGPGEEDQIGPLLQLAEADSRVTNLVGQTSIARLMAVIARSQLVIANDSAAAHIAVGFNRPLVALYGPTDVSLVGPYRHDADVIQHVLPSDALRHKDPANARLMERITVEEVLSKCDPQTGAVV